MGWWSKQIMGGDTPLDVECSIMDAIGIDVTEITDADNPRIADLLTKQQNELFTHVAEYESIGHQVLGFWMIKTGATFNEGMVEKIIESAKKDEWSHTDNDRMSEITSFCTVLEHYDGTPVEIPQTGLFDAIAMKFVANKMSATAAYDMINEVGKNVLPGNNNPEVVTKII